MRFDLVKWIHFHIIQYPLALFRFLMLVKRKPKDKAYVILGSPIGDYMAPPFHKFNEPERFKVHEGINSVRIKLEKYGIQ